MSEAIERIQELSFAASSAPTFYLNEALAEQLFTSQLGSIDNFVQKRAKELKGAAKLPVIEVGAGRNYALEATWDLRSPLTRALVLHSAMAADRPLMIEASLPRLGFAEVVSRVFMPAIPGLDDRGQSPASWAIAEDEAKRQVEVVRAFGDEDAVFWPLMFVSDSRPVACVANRKWFDFSIAASYLRPEAEVVAFGVLENVIGELPFLTLVYMRAF